MREPIVAPPPAEAAGGKNSGWKSADYLLWTSHWFFLLKLTVEILMKSSYKNV